MRIGNTKPVIVLLALGLFLVLNIGTPSAAELTVIYDSGRTQPIAPLLRPLLADDAPSTESTESANQNPPSTSLLGPAALSNLLPVRSRGLKVG